MEALYGSTAYHITVQAKHKTTLSVDAAVWRRFQEEVVRIAGPRATSAEVEKLLGASEPEPYLRALEAVFPRPGGGLPSLEDVERSRPSLGRTVAELIREDRDEREDRILGLKRNRKTVPRGRRQ